MRNREKFTIFLLISMLITSCFVSTIYFNDGGVTLLVKGSDASDLDVYEALTSRASNDPLTLLTEGVGDDDAGEYGFALAGAGDLNGDGFDDIVVGAPYASPQSKTKAGEVYIFYGSEDIAVTSLDAASADVVISGSVPGEEAGFSICIPGDINGDNRDDILIGSPGYSTETGNIFGFYSSTLSSAGVHTTSSADLSLQGSGQGARFGHVIVPLGDVDGDGESDVAAGAPGADQAYIMYGPTFGTSDRTHLIGPADSGFGTAVSGGTDLNSDGNLDFVIAAPTGSASSNNIGQVFLYFGYEGIYGMDTISTWNNTLTGYTDGDMFGQALSSKLDVDSDGYFDIIVGAPGDDAVYLYYGKTLIERFLYPNLWHMPGDLKMPVDFTSGVYNDVGANKDVNTYGLGNGDDGWDWGPNVLGSSSGSDLDHIYGAWEDPIPPYADAEGIDYGNNSRLEVIVGRSNTGPGPTLGWFTTASDSGAWGIEFSLTDEMYENITAGAEINLELDWEAHDALKIFNIGGGTEEPCYVKLRFTSSTTSTYLGTNIGGDSTAELFYWESANSMSSPFSSAVEHYKNDLSGLLTGAGSYYLEMGARMEKTDWFSTKDGSEGIVAFFDNVAVVIETLPITYSVKINGVSQSQFGSKLQVISDMNEDGLNEFAIGAPSSDLGGTDSGAMYIVYGDRNLVKQLNSNDAQRIITISGDDANLGAYFVDCGNLNGDAYNELLVAAPGFNGAGKVLAYSPARIPEISILQPEGGITASGELLIIAEASDLEDELDRFGVSFYYGELIDGKISEWSLIAQETSPVTRNSGVTRAGTLHKYLTTWDTGTVSDGFYQVKAVVTDNTYLDSEAVTETFEVDNPDLPMVEIIEPSALDQTFSGIVEISANCTDADSNLNFTTFYYSSDKVDWILIGTDFDGEGDIYDLHWDTEDLPDGDYFIRVVSNDTTAFSTEAVSVKFRVYNPGPPVLNFLNPALNDTLFGFVMLRVSMFDKDDNLASTGVEFYYSQNRNDWQIIEIAQAANADLSYSVHWNTVKVPDGNYWLRAFAIDTTNLSGEVVLGPLRVDNPTAPSIILERIASPNSGTIRLKATVYDDDSLLSSEGLTFHSTIDNETWVAIGTIKDPAVDPGTPNTYIFAFEWDTTTDSQPDSDNYLIKAAVKDITGLSNETKTGPVAIDNPDPPDVRLQNPGNGDKIHDSVVLGAYVDDPDGDIDPRGVIFYFSSDGKKWHLIDNVPNPTPGTELYQLDWDTTELPNGNYDIKAEVVDQTAMTSVSTVIVEIDNDAGFSLSDLSGSVVVSLFILMIIIIVLTVFLFIMVNKRRKERNKLEKMEERKELAREIKNEILKEQLRMYPSLAGTAGESMPVLPPFTHTSSPYSDAMKSAGSVERLLLPAAPSEGVESGTGPYTAGDAGGRTVSADEPTYAPGAGLTPQDVAQMKAGETGAVPVPSPQPVPVPPAKQTKPPIPTPIPENTPTPQPPVKPIWGPDAENVESDPKEKRKPREYGEKDDDGYWYGGI